MPTPDGSLIPRIIFAVLLLAAFAGFGWTLARYVRRIVRGRPEDRIPSPAARLKDGRSYLDVLVYWLGQARVADPPGAGYPHVHSSAHHLAIFWGFCVITVGTGEMLLQGVFPSFSYAWILGDTVGLALKYGFDVTNAVVLLVILYSFYRRLVVRPRLIPINLDASLILGMIGLLMVTHFIAHSAHWAHGEMAGHGGLASILITSVGGIWKGLSPGTVEIIAAVNWWVHVGIVLVFLNYIPYSKHVHLIGSLPNIFFRSHGQRGVMPKLNLEDESDEPLWGVKRYEQLSWKSILDTYACTECARCSNYCPAYNTDKPLSPMKLIHDIRYQSRDRGDLMHEIEKAKKAKDEQLVKTLEEKLEALKPLVADGAEADPSLGYLGTEALWSCTTCGACEAACPVFIEHPMKILEMRTNLVLEQEATPAELANAFKGIERNYNPWGIGSDKRMDWADEETPIFDSDNPVEFEYLFFVGCAGSYDQRCQKQTKALLKVLRAGGIKVAIAPEEVCCGDPARRPGNEMLFQMMAQQNVETFTAMGVKKIITFCPHCYHTLKAEYPQLGGNWEVRHHSEVIAELLAAGKLKLKAGTERTITYHDSCYLGRWNDIYDPPRAVARTRFVELERHGQRSFCCGAGGGRFWMEEHGPRVNVNRAAEVARTSVNGARPDVVAVGCPFCTTMLTDGIKGLTDLPENKDDKGLEAWTESAQVLDLAEIVAAALDEPAAATSETPAAE
jgi:Fe-S oxidoreductase